MVQTGLLTRNNSIDCREYKTSSNLQKKQVFDAVAAASIVNNCSGVDTSKSQVITLATFTKFLESRQQEKLTDDEIKALVKVHKNIYIFDTQSFLYAYIRTGNNNFESMFRIEFIFNQIEMESDSLTNLYLIIN